MLRKIALAGLIAFSVSFSTEAQSLKSKFKITKGPEFKADKGGKHSYITPLEDGGFFALKVGSKGIRDGKDIELMRFNSAMEVAKENEVSLKINDDKHELERFVYLNKTLFMITSYTDNKAKRNNLYATVIETKNLQKKGRAKKIATINFSGESKRNSGNFWTISSRDESKLAIFNTEPRDKNEPIDYSISMLDATNELEPIWERDFTTDKTAKLTSIIESTINSKGEAVILFKEYEDKRKEAKDNEPNYSYEIQFVKNNGEEVKTFPITLKDDFIFQMELSFNDENDLISSGFYSETHGGSIRGCYFQLIDGNDLSVKKESKKEFSMDFITDFQTERKTKKAKKKKAKGKDIGFSEFVLDNIITRDDGGAIQVAEQYYVRSHTSVDANGNMRTTYTYHYNTIIVISISPEGDIEWARKIPKIQVSSSSNNPWISYGLRVIGNNMYFFHIDDSENITAKDYKDLKSWDLGKKSVLMVNEINVEGYQRKDVIHESKVDKVVPMPSKIIKMDNGDLLLYAQWKKDARYYRLKIEE